jgi:hypothetical protein
MSQRRINRKLIIATTDGRPAPSLRDRYVQKLLLAFDTGRFPTNGIVELDVRHDDNCALLQRGSSCNCSPIIERHRV